MLSQVLEKTSVEVQYYDKIVSRKVDWLWYPYIPYGKLTIIQGDPGDGKTTFVLNLAAMVSKGLPFPESTQKREPQCVVYQNTEDGIEDTIKPRLESAGADCGRIAYIFDKDKALTFSDVRLEKAIIDSGARLLVLDPLQAFIGPDVDMHRANDIRPLMNRLANIAEKTKCAIILVGHMNKSTASKGLYRGLGSIDITASARSVLLVGRLKEDPCIRIMTHLKSNLAPEGQSIAFELNQAHGFRWLGASNITASELLDGLPVDDKGKIGEALDFLRDVLSSGQMLSTEVNQLCIDKDIAIRTLERAKQMLGVKALRKQGKWYWSLPNEKKEA